MTDVPSPLSVTTTPTGLRVSGELDSSTAQTLAGSLRSSYNEAGDTHLHMGEVTFIDSSGLQVLIDAHHAAEKRSQRFIISEPSPPVTRLLTISGLASYLHIQPSV